MADKAGRCVILGGGPLQPQELRCLRPGDMVIAADAGRLVAEKAGVTPDILLGDWDSAPPPKTGKEIITLPAEKDDTDTHHAARIAVQRGFAEVLLLGCLGGRLDHTQANLATLLYLTQQGVRSWVVDPATQITALQNGSLVLPQKAGYYFSVFAADGTAYGVTLQGMKYPLQNATVSAYFPIGVSNEIVEPQASITVTQGTLLLMYSKMERRAPGA